MPPPAGWAPWRDELVRIQPELFRLVVEWNKLQPSPDAPANLALPNRGCMRDKPPCAPYNGLQDQLRALAARQREDGWQALVVFTGTPEWAAVPPSGCPGEEGGGRAPRDIAAYRALVSGVLDLAAAEGAELHYLTPWNEPNHPYFIAPQRKACDALAPSRAVAPVRAPGARAAGRAGRARRRRPPARARRDGRHPRAELAGHVDRRR